MRGDYSKQIEFLKDIEKRREAEHAAFNANVTSASNSNSSDDAKIDKESTFKPTQMTPEIAADLRTQLGIKEDPSNKPIAKSIDHDDDFFGGKKSKKRRTRRRKSKARKSKRRAHRKK